MSTPALQLRAIHKAFGGVPVLAGASFELLRGEIHALLGENGAGKSTLMSVATGLYQPDAGEIVVQGRPAVVRSPRDAIRLGIGMVHQHFHLSRRHSVTDNVMLGLSVVGLLPDRRALADRVRSLAGRYGLPVDPDSTIGQLTVGEQQRVEIVKALIHESQILILDEPTSVLTPQESKELFSVLARLKADGRSIVFISHKLDELMEISDRVTIMRRGKVVATVETRNTNPAALATHMVGRDVVLEPLPRSARSAPRRLVTGRNLSAANDRGLPALVDVSFELMAGEILAVAGLTGNGQTELAEVLYGLRRATRGTLVFHEDPGPARLTPRLAIERGVAFVPADRRTTGTAPGLSVTDNLMLKSYRQEPYSRLGFLQHREMESEAGRLVERYDIRCAGPHQLAGTLSGGNLQKVILARELSQSPRIVLAVYPCRGLDVGSIETVRKVLGEARDRGAGILLVSEDLDEIFALADRVAVLCGGRMAGPFSVAAVDRVGVGLLMAGADPKGAADAAGRT